MKTSTKTEQPEWAMEIAREFVAAIDKPTVMSVPLLTGILAQSPTIKELVGAAEEMQQQLQSHVLSVRMERVRQRLQSALHPFKDSTGGG